MITVITFTLGTTKTFYTNEKITIELLKKFVNKVCPELSVRIHRDWNEEWLEMEGTVLATYTDGDGLYSSNEDMLNWKMIEEVEL